MYYNNCFCYSTYRYMLYNITCITTLHALQLYMHYNSCTFYNTYMHYNLYFNIIQLTCTCFTTLLCFALNFSCVTT